MTQTALTQAFVGHARVVTSLGQECYIDRQSCPLHLTIETPWGSVRFTMPLIVLPGGGDVVIVGQKTLREKLGTDVMAQPKASVLKAHGCQDEAGMEFAALAVGEPNVGAVLRAAMAVTAFGPGGDASGDVEDEVTLTPRCQRPMMFQDFEVEMQDRVGALEAAVDDAVDPGLPPECAKMLRDIVFRTHLDVFRRAFGRPTCARGAHDGAASARCKGGASEAVCIPASQGGLAARTHGQLRNSRNGVSEPAGDLRKRGDGNSQGIQLLRHGHELSGGDYAHAKPERQSVSFGGRDRMVHVGYTALLLVGAAG